jgi:ketosteroid isomerase-like protein
MHKVRIAALVLSAGLLSAAAPVASSRQSATDEVIAAERFCLDRWAKGDPSGFLTTYADEITYFDPMQPKRVDGVATLKAIYQPIAGTFKIDRYEILNPTVQRSGDVAVLTYNLRNYMKQADGTERQINEWNSTSVFRRIDGKWRTIHSHWSFTKPDIRRPGD